MLFVRDCLNPATSDLLASAAVGNDKKPPAAGTGRFGHRARPVT